jgi:GNAT superfamily N-acetyltransferase
MNDQNPKPKTNKRPSTSGFGLGISFGFLVSGFGFTSSNGLSRPPRYNPPAHQENDKQEKVSVAQADIIIADEKMLPRAVELYNNIFRPKREADFFKRRFMGRYNTLTLIARMDDKPVGFWIGFELKPGMFYHWLGAVVPDIRRHGVGRQLQEAQQAWAKDHGYEYIRCECMNHQREFIHFSIALGYDIVGIRWDSTHADNLVVFEKNLID